MAHPERLGKYRVTGVLGEGAMGIVYKGFDPDIRREVAIKTMRVAADADAGQGVSYADRFRNEAQAAGRLQHPGIVAVYDFGRDAGVDYIAMEYVRGNTLSRTSPRPSASSWTSTTTTWPASSASCSRRWTMRMRRASGTATSSRPT
jgi:serine/threonine protein kinase